MKAAFTAARHGGGDSRKWQKNHNPDFLFTEIIDKFAT